MNLDELRTVRRTERKKDTLQHLRDSFYEDAAVYIEELKDERERAAEQASDPFSAPEVSQLTDEIETAEEVVEAIYERRVGKVVKLSSFAAADMAADTDGLTNEEMALFDDLVDRIKDNRASVLAMLAGEGAPPTSSPSPDSADAPPPTGSADAPVGSEPSPADPERPSADRESAPVDPSEAPPGDSGGVLSDAMGVGSDDDQGASPSADPAPTEDARPGADVRSESADGAADPVDAPGSGAAPEGRADEDDRPIPPDEAPSDEVPASGDAGDGTPTGDASRDDAPRDDAPPAEAGADGIESDRLTLRITEDVGRIFGVDEREYDLAREDVVTLPEANAEPLLQRNAAERLE